MFAVRPLDAGTWDALEDLFGQAGASNGCWCMYWRIGPRYTKRPRSENRNDLRSLAGSGQPPGLVAFDGDLAVGWCELAPRADLKWLERSRYLGAWSYREPVSRSRAGVRPARFRGRGPAQA